MGTQNLWVFKICDYIKFQVGGRENQNICVFCISCEQKSICAFSIYAFCHICKNIPCELGLSKADKLGLRRWIGCQTLCYGGPGSKAINFSLLGPELFRLLLGLPGLVVASL